MSLTEYERLQILKWFEEAMGPDLGANAMKLFPPVGWGDIATKADLDALEHRLDTRIDGVLVTLRGEMAELRGGLRAEIGGLSGSLTRTFVSWLLVSQAAVIAVVGFFLG